MGQRKGDLYVLSKMKEANFSNMQNSGTEELWHQRLGHPQNSAIKILWTKKSIDVNSNKRVDTLCESCQLGKHSKLPFNSSSSFSTDIIERIHCDIWGPAPVLSLGKFRFYACFVDDYSHYMWIIPLRAKSEFFDVYLAFENYVQRQFNRKIKIFHTDGEGEFVNKRLESHFQQQEIIHYLSCPYTPEQTGIGERHHHTIRELGMTMIFHSGVPKFLGVEAFSTTVFLINRLPSSSLAFDTPYSRLYGFHPNYSTLHVFGSRCYPYTWNTKKINLMLKLFLVFL